MAVNRAAASEGRRGFSLSRRHALLGSAVLAMASILPPGCTRLDLSVLDRLAYALFPHPVLDMSVYSAIAAGFAKNAAEQAERLADAMPGDDGLTDWIAENLGNPDLLAFRFAVLAGLYGDLKVTSKFGYQGPSLEAGGYLERGFDDIDWLPEAKR